MLRYANPGDADPYGGHALSGAIPYVCIFILIILLTYVTMHMWKVKQAQTKLHDFMNQLLKDRVNLWKKFDQLDEEARALEQGMTAGHVAYVLKSKLFVNVVFNVVFSAVVGNTGSG